jgi:YVTN family beta-propeller protein
VWRRRRCFDRVVPASTIEEENMKSPSRVICASATLACAIAVVGAASASTSAPSKVLPRGGKVVATIAIPKGFGGFALGEGSVWAMSDGVSTLTRIDPQGNTVAARIIVKPVNFCPPYVCGEPAAGNGAVWVPRASDNAVSRIDLSTNSVTATIPVGKHPTAIAVTPGAVWVANAGGPSVSRIDPATNEVVATISAGSARAASDNAALTVGAGTIWASFSNTVVRIDLATNAVTATIRLSEQPCGFLAATERTVWAAGASCASGLTRIDPRTNRSAGKATGFLRPIGLALGYGSLWVADIDRKSIDRVDPRTGRIVARLPVGGIPIRLAVGFGSIWVRDDSGRVLRIKPQG